MERMTARFSTPCFLKVRDSQKEGVRSHQRLAAHSIERNLSQPSLLREWAQGPPLPRPGGPLVPATLTSGITRADARGCHLVRLSSHRGTL